MEKFILYHLSAAFLDWEMERCALSRPNKQLKGYRAAFISVNSACQKQREVKLNT